jgi:hypothetical protein
MVSSIREEDRDDELKGGREGRASVDGSRDRVDCGSGRDNPRWSTVATAFATASTSAVERTLEAVATRRYADW